MEKIFIDSNIIISANDGREPGRQIKAIKAITELIKGKNGAISTQVLQEYAATALGKLALDQEVVLRQLKLLESLEVVRPTPAMIRRAAEISIAYRINFWDAGIISQAEAANCSCLFSEDLTGGQYFSGIKIVNPLA
jgi:predicted nucleic acid-binding protein